MNRAHGSQEGEGREKFEAVPAAHLLSPSQSKCFIDHIIEEYKTRVMTGSDQGLKLANLRRCKLHCTLIVFELKILVRLGRNAAPLAFHFGTQRQ